MSDVTLQEPFGWELQLDLYGCAIELIKDADVIAEYAAQLVDLIGMKAYGPPLLDHFGHADPKTSGYTLVQRIETSLISGHFSEARHSAHLNIFSCRRFDEVLAEDFSVSYFRAEGAESSLRTRW